MKNVAHFNCTLIAHFMKYDLLIRVFDYHTNLFLDGKINYILFEAIEKEYLKRKNLFTINLN